MEQQYNDLVRTIMDQPERKTRNSITRSLFGATLTIGSPIANGFPLLNGRKLYYKGVLGELATFLAGNISNITDFEANGCKYWELWQDNTEGDITVDYGNAWRNWGQTNYDQLVRTVAGLQTDPNGRRHLITGWNPDNLNTLSLPCCHYAYQWYINADDQLEMMWHQRSTDVMIGLPSDIILAAAWNILMAQTIGKEPGRIIMTLGDTHIYKSHYAAVELYLKQAFTASKQLPIYAIDERATVFNFKPNMIEMVGYNPEPPISFILEA